MKRFFRLLGLLVLVAGSVEVAHAQQVVPAIEVLQPQVRARVVVADTMLQFRTQAVPGGQVDVEAGVLRAAYRIVTPVAPAATPEAAAQAYLSLAAPQFGWAADASDLTLDDVQRGRNSTHLRYQQTFFGLPVYNRQVKVNLDRDGQPTMVLSGYAPHLTRLQRFDTQPSIEASEAEARAADLVSNQGARTSTPTLVIYPSKTPRLAWKLTAWPTDAYVEWEVLLDARTGDLIQLFDTSISERKDETHGATSQRVEEPILTTPKSSSILRTSARATAQVQGSGFVFDPDPLTTAGVAYGAPYVDANDTDVAELNAQRTQVVLNDITQDSNDGLYRLEGPFVQVDGTFQQAYSAPAEADPNGFNYPRSDQHFEAVMVYYHIDRSQRYLQSLDLGRDIQNNPIRVNPHGLGTADNSRFFANANALAFGDGGIDDAEDADVIWHEYGHALLQASAPGLLATQEGQALHEGWSDYWAASYSRSLVESGAVPAQDWRKVFTWDGNNGPWQGRQINSNGVYPSVFVNQIHTDGLFWATAMMEVYTELGRTITDRLNLASHAYLNTAATFADAGAAIIQADIDLYGGAHLGVLLDLLGARNLVDPSVYGPVLDHDPITMVEQPGIGVTISVNVASAAAALDQVVLIYRFDGGAEQTLALNDQGGNRYEGVLQLAPTTSQVTYYIEATDMGGQQATLPAGAPTETYMFDVAVDSEAPTISHTAPEQVSVQVSPFRIFAEVTDNMAVDSVWVTFAVLNPSGSLEVEGFAVLIPDAGRYMGIFPIPIENLAPGSTITYRIHARDAATPPNERVLPAGDPFRVTVVNEGVLADFDFEVRRGVAEGAWAHGTPAYTLEVAHSGENVWSTGLEAAYPAAAGQSSLSLPSLNLDGLDAAFMTFWHWYDIEHDGSARPGETNAGGLWDGANIKVSTDEGITWTVLAPEDGYDGTINDGFGNPMEGESAWGGYSYGWQRVVVPLPTVDDVRLRFDFGTDESNAEQSIAYAGWFVDDVNITTVLPEDTTPPTFTDTPPAQISIDNDRPLPRIVVGASDDTGVTFSEIQYDIITPTSTSSGAIRMAMSLVDLSTFIGSIPLVQMLPPGSRIDYRIAVQDPDGNNTLFPAQNQPPLRIDFRLAEETDVFSGLRATGAWASAAGNAYSVMASSGAPDPVSSLVLEPFDVPANADEVQFTLRHSYQLGDGLGGNLKLSLDGGTTWTVLEPQSGYNGTFASDSHPMSGERIFSGTADDAIESVFSLNAYTGQQVRLRIDFGASRMLQGSEFWTVEQGIERVSTADEDFEMRRELALHPNYPDPFAANTTISYTLPEAMPVTVEVYDLLGRRVEVLANGTQSAGTHSLTMDRGNLASGLYIIRLMAGGTQKTERMIIAR